jgi:hypothetical protein
MFSEFKEDPKNLLLFSGFDRVKKALQIQDLQIEKCLSKTN